MPPPPRSLGMGLFLVLVPPPVIPKPIQPDTVMVTATVPRQLVVSLKMRWGVDTDEGVIVKALEEAVTDTDESG